jgi:hypothetical protein
MTVRVGIALRRSDLIERPVGRGVRYRYSSRSRAFRAIRHADKTGHPLSGTKGLAAR